MKDPEGGNPIKEMQRRKVPKLSTEALKKSAQRSQWNEETRAGQSYEDSDLE